MKNKMITLTEDKSNVKIYIAVEHIVTVFSAPEKAEDGTPNPQAGKTVVGFLGGSVVVQENIYYVLGNFEVNTFEGLTP